MAKTTKAVTTNTKSFPLPLLLSAPSSHDAHAYPSQQGKEGGDADLYGQQKQGVVAGVRFGQRDEDQQALGYVGGDELWHGEGDADYREPGL